MKDQTFSTPVPARTLADVSTVPVWAHTRVTGNIGTVANRPVWACYFGDRGPDSATVYTVGYTLIDVCDAVDRVLAAHPGARQSATAGTRTVRRGSLIWVWRIED